MGPAAVNGGFRIPVLATGTDMTREDKVARIILEEVFFRRFDRERDTGRKYWLRCLNAAEKIIKESE